MTELAVAVSLAGLVVLVGVGGVLALLPYIAVERRQNKELTDSHELDGSDAEQWRVGGTAYNR